MCFSGGGQGDLSLLCHFFGWFKSCIIKPQKKLRRAAFTLAEVLITLGVIGIVSSLILPSAIGNYEKQKNLAVLKKAYAELQVYFQDFKNETGCYDNLNICFPKDYEFQEKFGRFLYEKKHFQDRFPNTGTKTWYMPFVPFNMDFKEGTSAVYFKSMDVEGYDKHMLIAPSGLYMVGIDANCYDNYYRLPSNNSMPNYFRAMLWIYTDNSKFGEKWDSFRLGTHNSRKFARLGKQLFICFIMSDGSIVPNGSSLCRNYTGWTYHCQDWQEGMTCNPEAPEHFRAAYGCLGRIISDGWQIKYKW